jgi:hypothetical protein
MQFHIPESETPQPSEKFLQIFSMDSVPVFCTGVSPYQQVIPSKTYCSYVKLQIIPNAIYVIFV